MTPMLSIRGVKTYYGKIAALKGVDIDVNEGEIVTLIGSNGAGKSTLMMTVFGSPQAREGTITCSAKPAHLGRTTQVWDAVVTHRESGKTIALFRCTQMILYPKKPGGGAS